MSTSVAANLGRNEVDLLASADAERATADDLASGDHGAGPLAGQFGAGPES